MEWVPLGDKRLSSSPNGKNGQVKPLLDSHAGVNKFLRELLGDYPSFDADSVGEASVIPESSFEEVVAAPSLIAPC